MRSFGAALDLFGHGQRGRFAWRSTFEIVVIPLRTYLRSMTCVGSSVSLTVLVARVRCLVAFLGQVGSHATVER